MQEQTEAVSYGLSDVGLCRPNNEDVWIAHQDIGFYALADGMGGHLAGEIAAKEAIEHLSLSVREIFSAPVQSCPDFVASLRRAIEGANRKVYEMSRSSKQFHGMGTTLCCVLQLQDALVYAHVGDSRIYRFRREKLTLLTRDHSLYQKWISIHKRREKYPPSYPCKNVITRAVGTSRRANPELAVCSIEPGDLYILCSDGLSDVLSNQEIEQILDRSDNLPQAAQRLIEKAKIMGSNDNITVVLIQYPN